MIAGCVGVTTSSACGSEKDGHHSIADIASGLFDACFGQALGVFDRNILAGSDRNDAQTRHDGQSGSQDPLNPPTSTAEAVSRQTAAKFTGVSYEAANRMTLAWAIISRLFKRMAFVPRVSDFATWFHSILCIIKAVMIH